ncbi:hypothetical protein [Loktanella salsilacus]|uniref:hypothetical protein n=1 Tax=Loktanella salsilacus TaxID=195913 RepID=UPI003736DB1C
MNIPFEIPAEFLSGLSSGNLVRYGGILKDVGSGQIVGHLQETGALQSAVRAGFSFDPTGATGLIGIVQDAVISKKIDAMQGMLGTMQSLQIATLASSVAGIGVTAATTAMILHRLSVIDQKLEQVEGSVSELPNKWRDMDLRKKLGTLKTATERLQEAEVRPDAESVMRAEEERLNYVFDELHDGICNIVIQAKVDAGLLRSLLAGLALCGGTQIKALIWLDMKEAAEHRARRQCKKLHDLAFRMPRHVMGARLNGDREQARIISNECAEMRLRLASQPDLARTLIRRGINGREFIDQIQEEDNEPLLLLRPSN